MAADGFCQKCGAIMYNGSCSSCGYGKKKHTAKAETAPAVQQESVNTGGKFSSNAESNKENYSSEQMRTHKSNSKAWVAVMVLIIVILMCMIAGAAMIIGQVQDVFSNWTAIEIIPEQAIPEPEPVLPDEPISGIYDWSNDWNFEWGEDFEDNYEFEEYVPSLNDDFYEEIVSATVRGLDYDVVWNNNYMYPDDENAYSSFSYTYPVVVSTKLPFAEEINEMIKEEAMSYRSIALEGENFGYVDAYVTYMTSGLFSVVFIYDAYEGANNYYGVSALNFDMVTGELLTMEEMLPDYDFMDKYRAICEVQNDYSASIVLEAFSNDEIMSMIMNPETGVAFYNPVGIDIGFNYPDGWMTVTLKQ